MNGRISTSGQLGLPACRLGGGNAAKTEIRQRIITDVNNNRIQTLANPYLNGLAGRAGLDRLAYLPKVLFMPSPVAGMGADGDEASSRHRRA